MSQPPPEGPSLLWRSSSDVVLGATASASRLFLVGASRLRVNGLENFLKLLDSREDVGKRERGLVTVSNHLSVYDDPIMWGALPFRYLWKSHNLRWGLGSHDLMFNKKFSPATFWSLGQILPAHRLAHSKHGGLFQPTITQSIRLLSAQPFTQSLPNGDPSPELLASQSDPFTAAALTYTTNGHDSIPAPSAYLSRRHSWVHIFPEGRIHQHPDKVMRYFKWGVSRLILESEPCPALVPIWIEGFEEVMHEARTFPRPIPRPGKDVTVTFGDEVDVDTIFSDVRRRWKDLVAAERMQKKEQKTWEMGELSENLKYSEKARRLREETTMLVREELLKVRRTRGFPDEDPKARLVDTWREEGRGKREGQMEDGSWVKDT